MRIVRLEDEPYIPGKPPLTPEEVAEAYRLAREAFTAADLQRHTEIEEGIPFEQMLAELEEAQKQFDEKAP